MKSLTIAILAAGLGVGALSAASAAPVNSSASAQAPSAIVIYEQPNFKGRAMTFTGYVPSMAAKQFNDVAASVQIIGKRDWVLCEHRNFMGKCVRVRAKEKDLRRLQIAGQVSSLYPVRE
jgi:hypothetical protein